MPIPDYQTVMLPLLQLLSDGAEHSMKDIMPELGKQFKLTEDEMSILLPSGGSLLFASRVGWARTYLKKAGLVDSPKRAVLVITERGKKVLREKPSKIDNQLLRRFPEFVEFQNFKKETSELPNQTQTNEQTPEEVVDFAYQSIRQSLAQELIDTVRSLSSGAFERLVVALLVKMGYGGSIPEAGKAVGKTNDEGIDGTIKEDKLGLDIIYIQAKRWQAGNVVGRPELHKFVGALAGQGAKKGIFITTSSFSKDALNYAPKNETKIVLIDGVQLAQLMIDYNIGVSAQRTYEIKRLDNDYFEEV
jgi:restriction system protein